MRRWLILLTLFIGFVGAAACGTGETPDTSSDVATPTGGSALSAARDSTAAPSAPTTARVAPQLPSTVTDKDGRTVTISDVSRIIPLNGDLAEIIWALGLGDNVVATDTSATYPEAATKLPKVGYQRQLAAEGILSLRPTLIIGNEAAGPPAVIDQLRSAGVTVLIIAYPATLDGALGKIRTVATALGVPEAGTRLAAQTQQEIDAATALAARATSRPRVAFLYVRGNTTQMIGGKDSGAEALIAAAGGIDAGATAGIEGFKPLTPEALVAAQPDVLLLLSAGLESVGGVDGLLKLPGVAQTPAGRNRRVLAYDDQYLLGMGPRVGQALMDLAKGLHPELP
jgi:iron complex transport system substrate-binding protein